MEITLASKRKLGFVKNLTGSNFVAFMASHLKEKDPIHFKEAVKHQKWINAMNEEIEALENNDTWDVTSLPKGKKAIG